MRFIKTCLALVAAALTSTLASAGTLQSLFYFQDDLSEPVGMGTMNFDGELGGDAIYAATSFTNLTFDFVFHPFFTELGLFTEADLVNDLSDVSIYVIGETFQFTGAPSGVYNASAEFINGEGDYLAFSPSFVPQFAYVVFIDEVPTSQEDEPDITGVYGAISAIPEPATAATLIGATALGASLLRRRRNVA
ncbi:MAG: hypothetical protein K0R17_2774 [Rariglobus sp.]|jgi:hypothetical protein|nr:hypothetical protein [Rariglobus sp.]